MSGAGLNQDPMHPSALQAQSSMQAHAIHLGGAPCSSGKLAVGERQLAAISPPLPHFWIHREPHGPVEHPLAMGSHRNLKAE